MSLLKAGEHSKGGTAASPTSHGPLQSCVLDVSVLNPNCPGEDCRLVCMLFSVLILGRGSVAHVGSEDTWAQVLLLIHRLHSL